MVKRALLWASRNQWLAHHLPRYRFAQAAARRFMPGEDLEAALSAAEALSRDRITTVLSRLGENVTSLGVTDHVAEHYAMVLDRIAERRLPAQISLKLTHLGLALSTTRTSDHLRALAAHAASHDSSVWVDMEGSAYTQSTLDVFLDALGSHQNIGLCIQAYLRRTERDLEQLLGRTTAIRLVKGAYAEPADIAFPRKRDVDDAYHRLALRLLKTATGKNPRVGPPPALATHDTRLIDRIADDAVNLGVPRDAYEIQMLYGIRTPDQHRLAQAGSKVRVLISYGPEWFAWFVRRLAERPANLAFVARNLIPV
jgi:proline dehydrogenase